MTYNSIKKIEAEISALQFDMANQDVGDQVDSQK